MHRRKFLASPLVLDFSAGVPAGVTPSNRTGGSMTLAMSISTAVRQVAGAQGLYEDRGGGLTGVWSIPPLSNLIPDPLDFSAASWSKSATVSAPNILAPDGTNSANSITDSDPAANKLVLWGGTPAVDQRCGPYWVQNDVGNLPNINGGVDGDGAGDYGCNNPGSTSWRRVPIFSNGVQFRAVYPTGFLCGIHMNAPATIYNVAGVGTVNAWAISMHDATAMDMPGALTTSSAQDYYLSAGSLARVVSHGDLDVEIRFWGEQQGHGFGLMADGYIFSATTPTQGKFSVRVGGGGQWTAQIKGVDVATFYLGSISIDKEVVIRLQCKPSLGASGGRFRVEVGGCAQLDVTFSAAGAALEVPTAFSIGSDQSTAGTFFPAWFTKISFPVGAPVTKLDAEFLVLGESSSGSYASLAMVGSLLYTQAEAHARPGIANMATAGSTIQNQQAVYLGSEYAGAGGANVKAVLIWIGVNNIIGQNDSANTIIGLLQTLVNTLKANMPNVKITLGELTPMKAGFTAPQYAVWQSLNTQIGAGAVTGVDAIVFSYVAALNDGADNLLIQYSYDGEHCNDFGRAIIAAADRAALVSLGLLP
jgi:hypothetical protein